MDDFKRIPQVGFLENVVEQLQAFECEDATGLTAAEVGDADRDSHRRKQQAMTSAESRLISVTVAGQVYSVLYGRRRAGH